MYVVYICILKLLFGRQAIESVLEEGRWNAAKARFTWALQDDPCGGSTDNSDDNASLSAKSFYGVVVFSGGSMLIGVLIHLFECWLGSSIEDRWFGKDEIADFGEGIAAEQGEEDTAPEDLELV